MNKHIIQHIFAITCTTILFSACKQEVLRGPIEKSKGAPGAISQVQIENRNGYANIIYQLPDNPDLAYVKAVYDVGNGTKREIKASYYTNRMTLDGFGDTLVHQVQLYAVNRGEEASTPVTITVQPLVAPITLTYRNMRVVATFGGINIQAINIFRYPLVIMPLYDSTGKGGYSPLENIYTEDSLINRNIRGLDTVPTKFAVSIRDRFLNHTDTVYATLKPIFEQLLDRLNFSSVHLPNDARYVYSTNEEMMWDGRSASQWPSAFTDESAGGPVSFTMNLGKATILSRFKFYPYMEIGSNYYIRGNVRFFEVYGSNNPAPDGSWGSWTKLRDGEVIKPSGQPYGTETTSDQELAVAGWEFDFPPGLPAYKYLRFKLLRTWQGHYGFSISQMKIWGASL